MAKQLNFQSNLDRLLSLNVHLLSRRITCMTVPAIVEAIHTACVTKNKITVAHYNVHGFNLSMQLPWFYNFLQGADITHCDGSGILKAISYMGLKLPIQYRASYTALMPESTWFFHFSTRGKASISRSCSKSPEKTISKYQIRWTSWIFCEGRPQSE